MTVYVTHSSSFDYQNELYTPLRQSDLNNKHQLVLPHEKSSEPYDSKELLQSCDLVLAEVSFPSTGQGIELGWAASYGRRIVCFYRKGSHISSSLVVISKEIFEYEDEHDMLNKLSQYV